VTGRQARGKPSQGETSALASLGAAEQGAVLEELLRRRPELRREAERIAREQLADTDREAVAEELEGTLRSLSSDELNARAGRQRWGYVEPTEAAWELLDESVEPYGREIERLDGLGMTVAAVETALGVVTGLYRCRGCDDSDLLLSWAPDFPAEAAGDVIDALVKAGIDVSPESVAEAAPEWADGLASRGRAGA
jgi:hypothetical protein